MLLISMPKLILKFFNFVIQPTAILVIGIVQVYSVSNAKLHHTLNVAILRLREQMLV
jgi:hypothetical protein